MIESVIRWSLASRALVLAAAALLLGWGTYKAVGMDVDVFPDLTAPTVSVVAEAHGMSPEEVERLVTFPIETALNGAAGVRRVRSSTSIGSAVIWIDFDWGTDIHLARQVVSEKLQLARATLPPDLPPPVLAPVSSIMGEILFVALTSDRHSTIDIKTMADWQVRRRLLAEPGVAQVIPIGGDTKQFQVLVKPEQLAAYNLTLDEVVQAVRDGTQTSSAGFVTQGGQEYLIEGVGRAHAADEIGAALVTLRDGRPVLVRDVAEVAVGPAPKRGTGSHNGEPAVVIGIQKQPGVNTLDLTRRLDTATAEIQQALPEGMKLETRIFRQADFISTSIDNLMAALRDGAILVVAIVFAFLVSGRATLVSLLAIPLSLVVAILALQAFGATINTMTLGGMAIALGALVDDAIIVVENIVRRLRENAAVPAASRRPAATVVLDATREIQGSIVFATLIIMLVFLPLFALTGVEGRLLAPLGYAYVVAIAASLLVAVTVTPVLSLWVLPQSKTVGAAREGAVALWCKRAYEPLLRAALDHARPLLAASALLALLSLVGLALAGRSFLPDFNEGSLTISAVTLPGTSLEQSDALARLVEQTIRSHPEVVSTARRTGRAELDEHAQEVNASEIDVALRMGARSKEEFLDSLRGSLSGVPGMNITIGQPISHRIDHLLSGTRANIAVKLFGPDLLELRRLAASVQQVMGQVEGVVDLSAELQADVPLLSVRFDREALARAGMTVRDAAEAVETAFVGQEVGKVPEGQANFDLVVRYDPSVKADLDAVRETLMTVPTGARLPLHALADIRRSSGPNVISRENVQRKMVVMANVAGRDLLGVVEDIRSRVAGSVALPAGYRIEYGGQFESATAASQRLLVIGAVVVIGVFGLLYLAFHSGRDAGLVMLNLPLAMVGGVVGLYASGGVLSVASIIGFITLFGIATRNGVMMVAHVRHLLESGEETSLDRAVERGATERLVPILMTALATGLALIPLALNAGEPGSEIQAPMAIVILFGLLSSTALNMLVLPAAYRLVSARGEAG